MRANQSIQKHSIICITCILTLVSTFSLPAFSSTRQGRYLQLNPYETHWAANKVEKTIISDLEHSAEEITTFKDLRPFLMDISNEYNSSVHELFPTYLYNELRRRCNNRDLNTTKIKNILKGKFGKDIDNTINRSLFYTSIYALINDNNNDLFMLSEEELRFYELNGDILHILKYMGATFRPSAQKAKNFSIKLNLNGNMEFVTENNGFDIVFAEIPVSRIDKEILATHDAIAYFFSLPDVIVAHN